MLTVTRFFVGVTMGVALGVMMLLVGGITWQPPTPACPGCAILAPGLHCPGGGEAVQGGEIC
jgi:hypothetical protein